MGREEGEGEGEGRERGGREGGEGDGEMEGEHLLSANDISNIDNKVVIWCPLFKLSMPCRHGGERHDHEEWTVQLMVVREVMEE